MRERERGQNEDRQTERHRRVDGWMDRPGGTDIERYVFQSDDPMQTDGFDNI